MTTKRFKIGLSNAEKQAMAQDVYERLLDLTFPEYDTSETYAVGDFVVYNDQLYKCIGATSGAWDSTKWQLATLNDLLTDIESAVAFVNDKANVDGNYPTLTAGLADNLTPYSEDSGAEQTNPFISNGTGTNNNTEIVTVGDYALLKEKQGHTLVVNQLFAVAGSTETINGVTFTNNNDGSWSVNGTANADITTKSLGTVKRISGHKVLLRGCPSNGSLETFYLREGTAGVNDTGNGVIYTIGSSGTVAVVFIIKSGTTLSNIKITPKYDDLTQMFNGDIPQDLLDNPDHFSWYYNGSLAYNTGSLVNANGVKLVSTGRNLFDEETELGTISNLTGENSPSSTTLRTKNYIRVVPNTDYYFYSPITGQTTIIAFAYDKDKNFIGASFNNSWAIGSATFIANTHQKVPSNCEYLKLVIGSAYGTTYNHDITISKYYSPEEGGEGYDKYYPYEEPYVVETGNEVLRSAGSVKDYKEPDGTIHRLVGAVDLGSLNWQKIEIANGKHAFYTNLGTPTNIKLATSAGIAGNLLCPKYKTLTGNYTYAGNEGISLWSTQARVCIYDASLESGDATAFKSAMSGVYLFYELETETTEQGTPFAENLPINDYGMLYWLDSSNNLVGIPQGCKIFYPVNYKGFLDDLYSKVDGNSDDYALNSELNAKFETYLKSLTGYDETATQVLKNVEGTLTWVTEE